MGAHEPGDLTRSRQQMYDLKYKSKKTDEVDELLQYSKQKEESIILEHYDVPEDLWVLGKKHMTSDLLCFCTYEKLCYPFSIDTTFSFGKYEITPFTYKHLFLKCERTGGAPTFLGPTALQYTEEKSVYKSIVSAVCNSAPTLAEKGKSFITDSEDALHSAFGEVLTHATPLRCFRPFQQNCQDKLQKLGIQQKQHQKVFLDTVFGKQGVSQGILDANTKDELHEKLTASRELLETEEKSITGTKVPRFWKYVNSHKEMIEKCMIGDARKRVGMPCDQSGTRLCSYTNQSESINNKLTRQKEAIVKNDKNKVDLSKLQFTKDVWEEVDKHQQEELHMAICGLKAEDELADLVAHLAVPPEEWFEMSVVQRVQYVQIFNQMTVEEAMQGKSITVSKAPSAKPEDVREFSIDLNTSLQSVSACLADLIRTIVKEVQNLLNCNTAIQQMPSLDGADKRKKYLVAAKT